MKSAIALLTRYRVSLVIVVAACAAVAGVFAFAKPVYDREQGSEMIDIAELHHYPLAEVRAAFAKHGLPLRLESRVTPIVTLSTAPRPWDTTAFYVYYVTTTSGRMSWGPESDTAWEARTGNLLVHYGGADEAMLARVKAAVGELD